MSAASAGEQLLFWQIWRDVSTKNKLKSYVWLAELMSHQPYDQIYSAYMRHMFCAILLVIYHQVLMITQEHLKIWTKKHGSFNQAPSRTMDIQQGRKLGMAPWKAGLQTEKELEIQQKPKVNQERSWTHHKHSMRTSRKREDLKERRSCTEEKS